MYLPVCQIVQLLSHLNRPPRLVPRGLDPPPRYTTKLDNVMAISGYSSTCNNSSASWGLEAKVDRGIKR